MKWYVPGYKPISYATLSTCMPRNIPQATRIFSVYLRHVRTSLKVSDQWDIQSYAKCMLPESVA